MMRAVILFAAVALAGDPSARTQEPARPRLVVLCVVDQLATWVHAQGAPFFAAAGGFRRLEREGVTFTNCAFEHACSETGPGHATIGTGAPASRHGIVKNTWWSPAAKDSVYCVSDRVDALPDLPEGKDRGPGRLLAPTLAMSLKAHVAGSKVASVAWKDRSAILMVGPGADVAAWIEKKRGMLTTNRAWCDETPDWIAKFNRDRVLDQWFGTVWARSGPEAAYAGLVDDRPWEWVHGNGARQRTLPQPLTGGKDAPELAYYEQLYRSPWGNTAVRHAAEAALLGMQLGKDDVPDLLCVSFSSTDVVGHEFGPDSVEARDALLRLDLDLAGFFATLDREVGVGRWSLFLTADHGVGPSPEAVARNGVPAGRGPIDAWVRSAVEGALRQWYGEPPEGANYVAHVGEAGVYFDDATLDAKGLAGSRDVLARVAATAAGRVRGMMVAYATVDVVRDEHSDDPIRRALAHAIAPGRAGDVQLVLKPYWLNGATPGAHGTAHAYDREVVAFAMGSGIAAGARVATPITPGFGAVLLAALLGVPKPTAAHEHVPDDVLAR